MKTFQPKTPRTAIAFAAIAMTALTLSLSIVAPAHMESASDRAGTIVASQSSVQSAAIRVEARRAEI